MFIDACIAEGDDKLTKGQVKKYCSCAGDEIFSSNIISDKMKKSLSEMTDMGTTMYKDDVTEEDTDEIIEIVLSCRMALL